MSPKQSRHKLLLDEMFPRRNAFPQLNSFHDLKHVVHDYHLENNGDPKVVRLAKLNNRILISKNEKHMIELCKNEMVRLICITEAMSQEEIDSQIMAVLRRLSTQEAVIKLSRPIRKAK